MSEGSFWPKTWKEAIPLIVWGILIFAAGFEGVAALVHAEWLSSLASFVLMVGLTAMLIHGKTWLASINPNWLVGAVIVALTVITFSPFVERWPFSLAPIMITISAALLLIIGSIIGAAIFRRRGTEQTGQPLSHQELDYRAQQRKFILSNLNEMLAAYLFLMSSIGDKCGRIVGNGFASQMHWFADYALHRGIRRQYGELQKAAVNNFVDISTETINGDILRFLLEYQNVSSFPEKIERLAGLEITPRDDWDRTHQRCKSALLDLKASLFSGILTESTAMDTLQTTPRNR